MAAMALLDTQVATILQAVHDAGIGPRTTVFVVSDHGFKTVKRQIRPNAIFAKEGLLKADGGKVASAQVYSVPEGGSALVYVTVPDERGALLAKAKAVLAGVEGIDRVVEAPEFSKYGLPAPTAAGGSRAGRWSSPARSDRRTTSGRWRTVRDTPRGTAGRRAVRAPARACSRSDAAPHWCRGQARRKWPLPDAGRCV